VTLCVSLTFTVSAAKGAQSWEAIERAARGQTVYFNAWAGDDAINNYIGWAAREVAQRYAVRLVHVKLSDTAVAVNRILGEQAAGRLSGGSTDLIWINGENFASLMQRQLLYGPWADRLPNVGWLDDRNPTVSIDFTLATNGFELAWGGARFTLFYDSSLWPAHFAMLAWICSALCVITAIQRSAAAVRTFPREDVVPR
jgi:putative thiamine transport system substrate-binding protein